MPHNRRMRTPRTKTAPIETLLAPGDRFLDDLQTAQLLATTRATLNYWRATGNGPRFHKLGRNVRYLLSDITAWTAARAVGSDRIRA
jgi:predicted DNA-binding transcriptional regulator AlpA